MAELRDWWAMDQTVASALSEAADWGSAKAALDCRERMAVPDTALVRRKSRRVIIWTHVSTEGAVYKAAGRAIQDRSWANGAASSTCGDGGQGSTRCEKPMNRGHKRPEDGLFRDSISNGGLLGRDSECNLRSANCGEICGDPQWFSVVNDSNALKAEHALKGL